MDRDDRDDRRDDDAPRPPHRWRRIAAGAAGVVAIGGLVAASGPIADRLPTGDGLAETAIVAPSDQVLDQVARRDQPPAPQPTDPVCLRAPGADCFRWTVTEPQGGEPAAVVADDLLLLRDGARDVVARRISDGTVAWRTDTASSRLLATEDLFLELGADGLIARATTDGTRSWRNPELDARRYVAAAQDGDHLVVAEDLSSDEPDEPDPTGPAMRVVGLDVTTGEVSWQLEADGPASLADDGTTVYVDEDGDLVALAADGSPRWRVPDVTDPERGDGGAWITGRYVAVWDVSGSRDRLHRLHDGRELDVDGWVLTSDDRHTLLNVREPEGSSGLESSYVLLDAEDDEVWRVPALHPMRCAGRAQLTGEHVLVWTCEQETLVLDRSDGTTVERRPTADGSGAGQDLPVRGAGLLGPYELRPDVPDGDGSYTLIDQGDDTAVARFPPGSTPVSVARAGTWGPDLGGVAVIRYEDGLAAIDLHEGDGRATGDGR